MIKMVMSFISFLSLKNHLIIHRIVGDYVDLLRRVNLYKPNYDKGRILEVLIFLLLQKALMELYRISDR